MGYEWLPAALVALRGIEAYEVLQVLGAPRRLPVPAQSAGIRFLTIWARTRAGRPLIDVGERGLVVRGRHTGGHG